MHPFSLNKEEQQSVNGGFVPEKKPIDITHALNESGDSVTMAIPEDGNDPFPFDVM